MKSPPDVAKAILQNLPDSDALIGETSIAGPGFINIRLSLDWLSERVSKVGKDKR